MSDTAPPQFGFTLRSGLRLALDSLRANRLRSFLTLLGIIIGVSSVILVGSAIDGLGLYADESVSKAFGSESYILQQVTNAKTRTEYFEKLRRNHELKLGDERFLAQVNNDNSLYSVYANSTIDTKREDLTSEDTTIIGSSADLADIRDMVLTDGRYFSRTEEQRAALVAVIGDDLKNNLFPNIGDPVGHTFKIQGIDFTVVGILDRVGSSFGRSQDNVAYIPITSYERLFGPGRSLAIFGRPKPESGYSMQQSLDMTRVALRTRFHQKPGEDDRFDTLTPDAIRGFIDQLLAIVALVVVPITAISLVVGGIVIMNIMLVSVTERTREIGIRKSLGAKRSDIMTQILLEAVLMAFAGGAVGVGLGAVLTRILTAAFGVTLRVTLPYVAMSVFVSGAVGMISGWYPASRAAKLDPIVALRAE